MPAGTLCLMPAAKFCLDQHDICVFVCGVGGWCFVVVTCCVVFTYHWSQVQRSLLLLAMSVTLSATPRAVRQVLYAFGCGKILQSSAAVRSIHSGDAQGTRH
eukprot:GHRQ01019631.1.p2 GENE.GHRQ01019631.1~~GHRQ01019631.1.p2  ORF type:complete len:102 (+),score=13.57 GHRQ01019631.1:486-791(+)